MIIDLFIFYDIYWIGAFWRADLSIVSASQVLVGFVDVIPNELYQVIVHYIKKKLLLLIFIATLKKI